MRDTIKRALQIIAIALTFMSTVWYIRVRPRHYLPFSVRHFVLSSLLLIIAGLALEMPSMVTRPKQQKGRIVVDWLTLLIFGLLPLLMASCIPLSYFGIPVHPLICSEPQSQIGAFWLGIAIGRSITVRCPS